MNDTNSPIGYTQEEMNAMYDSYIAAGGGTAQEYREMVEHVKRAGTPHNCDKKHRSYRALAKCIFPGGNNVNNSNGQFAVVRWCPPPRWTRLSSAKYEYSLHPTREDAQTRLDTFFNGRCGEDCTGNHDLIHLEFPS